MSQACVPRLYETFIAAFADYVFPFALTLDQFRNHIALNAVDVERSMGCFEGEALLGFSLNGFGEWQGTPTVYDAGTGVIPNVRRQGISLRMFESMIPILSGSGIKQFLLEVVTTNSPALNLYEKLGFHKTRTLALLQCDTPIDTGSDDNDIAIVEMSEPDWDVFLQFWRVQPSWQNSREAVDRSSDRKRIFAAYRGDNCVGYTVFSAGLGRISQIAVSSGAEGQGIGRRLLRAVQQIIPDGVALQIINADMSNPDVHRFFTSLGFYERLSQYEMIREM